MTNRDDMPPPKLALNRDTWEWEWRPFLAYAVKAGPGALRRARKLVDRELPFNNAVDVAIVSRRGREVLRIVNPFRPPRPPTRVA